MAPNDRTSGEVRTDTDSSRPNGSLLPSDDYLRESGDGHVDCSPEDAFRMHKRVRARDRVAMVVQKTGRWMRESSLAEKAVAVFLAIIMGLLFNMNREIGEVKSAQESHLSNHPNVALEQTQEDHEQRIRDLERRTRLQGP